MSYALTLDFVFNFIYVLNERLDHVCFVQDRKDRTELDLLAKGRVSGLLRLLRLERLPDFWLLIAVISLPFSASVLCYAHCTIWWSTLSDSWFFV